MQALGRLDLCSRNRHTFLNQARTTVPTGSAQPSATKGPTRRNRRSPPSPDLEPPTCRSWCLEGWSCPDLRIVVAIVGSPTATSNIAMAEQFPEHGDTRTRLCSPGTRDPTAGAGPADRAARGQGVRVSTSRPECPPEPPSLVSTDPAVHPGAVVARLPRGRFVVSGHDRLTVTGDGDSRHAGPRAVSRARGGCRVADRPYPVLPGCAPC
jgi:hypothetical protein